MTNFFINSSYIPDLFCVDDSLPSKKEASATSKDTIHLKWCTPKTTAAPGCCSSQVYYTEFLRVYNIYLSLSVLRKALEKKSFLINNSVLSAIKKGGGREGIIDCNLNMQYCSIFVVIEKEVEGF